ncbi:MAG: site-specific integrase [Lachnospiraceae bacterium]|nr:site-specific integrase [Lachnospiraceae bacterium]
MAKNIQIVSGTGCWDKVNKNGYEYFRFRKTYGPDKKEFFGKTKKEVLDKIAKYESNPVTKSQKYTLQQTFEQYIKDCCTYFAKLKRSESLEPSSFQQITLNHINFSRLGKTQLGCVTADLVTRHIMTLRDKEYSRKTINQELHFIKRCLKRAYEDGLLKENPAQNVAPLSEKEVIKKTKKIVSLEEEDMKKLLEEAKRINTYQCQVRGAVGERVYGVNGDIVCFLIYSGLRIGECLALTWDDVENIDGTTFISINATLKEMKDPATGKYCLQRKDTKTECSKRKVALCSAATVILEEQKKAHPGAQGEDYVFLSDEGTPVMYRNVNRTLRCMLKRAECKNQTITVHALRHTYGSYLVSNGADIYAVSKMLGHSSVRITETVYAEVLNRKNASTASIFDAL